MHNESILGLGTDIIEIARIKQAIERRGKRLLEHLFTEKERKYCERYSSPFTHYAGRFAAKEAILKSLGTGVKKGSSWQDIEILNNKEGKPEVFFSKKIQQRLSENLCCLLSISHSREFAVATAILVKKPETDRLS